MHTRSAPISTHVPDGQESILVNISQQSGTLAKALMKEKKS